MFTVESVRFFTREAAELYSSIERYLLERNVKVLDGSLNLEISEYDKPRQQQNWLNGLGQYGNPFQVEFAQRMGLPPDYINALYHQEQMARMASLANQSQQAPLMPWTFK